jgi:hypothetical protein
LWANYIIGHFKGYFEGAKTLLTPKLSRAQRGAILGSKKTRPPRNILRNGPLCSLPKTKKNNIPNFQKLAVHWYFYVPLRPEPSILSFYIFIFLLFYCFIVLIKICGENPAKYPRLSKNPPKYTTAYIVHQSNCRWH